MSILNKLVTAITPLESEAERVEAREHARAEAVPDGWLWLVLDHHWELEDAFAALRASTGAARVSQQRLLAALLAGHLVAEERVLYPALIRIGDKRSAKSGYADHAALEAGLAELEKLDPATDTYVEQLEILRMTFVHHTFEEEGTWFRRLKREASAADQLYLRRHYAEEFDRYVNGSRELDLH